MRSGGLRGLQILWSGASGVRGGFDSHAFPPIFRLVLALALGLAGPMAHAQTPVPAHKPPTPPAHAPASAKPPAPADSLAHAVPDTAAVHLAPDTLTKLDGIDIVSDANTAAAKKAHQDSLRAQGWSAQPRFVMMRSLLFPGWGQAYNRAWYKAGAIAAGETWLGITLYNDQQKLNDLQSQIDQARLEGDQPREAELVNEYNTQLDQRTAHMWFLGAVLTYAMVDAYVDAHFRNFDFEFKHDRALPAGSSPATPKGSGGGTTRLGLRWHF